MKASASIQLSSSGVRISWSPDGGWSSGGPPAPPLAFICTSVVRPGTPQPKLQFMAPGFAAKVLLLPQGCFTGPPTVVSTVLAAASSSFPVGWATGEIHFTGAPLADVPGIARSILLLIAPSSFITTNPLPPTVANESTALRNKARTWGCHGVIEGIEVLLTVVIVFYYRLFSRVGLRYSTRVCSPWFLRCLCSIFPRCCFYLSFSSSVIPGSSAAPNVGSTSRSLCFRVWSLF